MKSIRSNSVKVSQGPWLGVHEVHSHPPPLQAPKARIFVLKVQHSECSRFYLLHQTAIVKQNKTMEIEVMAFFMLETLKSSETTFKTTLTSSIKTKTDGFNVFS